MSNTLEQEIEAMRQIASALDKLTPDARVRVIQYVLAQSGIESVAPPERSPEDVDIDEVTPSTPTAKAPTAATTTGRKPDIRALVGEKQPRSAIEMATLVAYYLAELSPEKKETVNVDDLQKYFKQGAYPLPAIVRFALTNAKDSGYLEAASRGEYRLTSVGHNLVAHEMPTKGGGLDKPAKKAPRPRKKKRK